MNKVQKLISFLEQQKDLFGYELSLLDCLGEDETLTLEGFEGDDTKLKDLIEKEFPQIFKMKALGALFFVENKNE